MKNNGKSFKPDDLKDEFLGPTVFDKLKKIDFDDLNLMKNLLHLTEEEIESI